MDLRDGPVTFQEFRDGFGIVAMFLHSDREGLDPPQREPTVERARNRAERVLGELELLVQVVPAHHDRATYQIRMPADAFRSAMDDQVDPESQRILQCRRRE